MELQDTKKTYDKNIGACIKSMREAKGYSQQYLADRLGVTRAAISYYESGARPVTFSTFLQICDIFNFDKAEMLARL